LTDLDFDFWLTESVPIIGIDVCLAQDTAQGADWNIVLAWDNRYINCRLGLANEFDVTTLLGGFEKPSSL
jgi:hypothetical protein